MARVILNPAIKSVSGKVGNLIFKTYKNGQVRVYKVDEVPQRTHISPQELANRRRFGLVAKITAYIQHSYEWVDEAAKDRHSIRKKVRYHYDKILDRLPNATDEELAGLILMHFSSTSSGHYRGNIGKK